MNADILGENFGLFYPKLRSNRWRQQMKKRDNLFLKIPQIHK